MRRVTCDEPPRLSSWTNGYISSVAQCGFADNGRSSDATVHRTLTVLDLLIYDRVRVPSTIDIIDKIPRRTRDPFIPHESRASLIVAPSIRSHYGSRATDKDHDHAARPSVVVACSFSLSLPLSHEDLFRSRDETASFNFHHGETNFTS